MGPITVTLLVVLGALLFMILKKLFERPAAPNPSSNAPRAAPKQDLGSLTVADARVGDNISIPGAGDNFSDLDFTVEHSNRYEAGEKQWFDLSGKHGERRGVLEVRKLPTMAPNTKNTRDQKWNGTAAQVCESKVAENMGG